MEVTTPRDSFTRFQLFGAAALALVSLAVLLQAALISPDVPFISPGGKGEWISYPIASNTDAIPVDLERVAVYAFEHRFRLASVPESVELSGRALRFVSLAINDKEVVAKANESNAHPPQSTREDRSSRSSDWKQGFEAEVAAALRPGVNVVRAEVKHPKGPPLLQLSLSGDGVAVHTNTAWRVALMSGDSTNAVIAEDTRRHAESLTLPTPRQLFGERFGELVLLFTASALCYALAQHRLPARIRIGGPQITLAVISLYWVALFATKMVRLPVMMGFDIPAHLQYIDFLLEEGRLPLATEGWSAYHPPLFYLLTSALVAAVGSARESLGGQVIYRLIPFVSGLANVWMTYWVARRLFADQPLRIGLAVAVAGLLPMNLYMSAYVSNEQLHGAWVSLALLVSCGLLLTRGAAPLNLVVLALALGCAIATKFTSLLVVPVVLFFLVIKLWWLDQRSPPVAIAIGALVLLGTAALGGGFYLRNWLHFGKPIVGNWDVPGSLTWWEQPGFHTLGYYSHFGEVLRHPYFAGYASFWDGVYSTLWGDGLAAGMVSLTTRHPMWNYDFMTLTYALGLPATLLFFLGFGRMLRDAFRGEDVGRRLALSLLTCVLFVVAFALLRVTISLPYYAQAKAFYAIATVVPLSLVGAAGLAAPLEHLSAEQLKAPRFALARVLYVGWLGTLAGCIALAFLG